jgi:hypothetical protein
MKSRRSHAPLAPTSDLVGCDFDSFRNLAAPPMSHRCDKVRHPNCHVAATTPQSATFRDIPRHFATSNRRCRGEHPSKCDISRHSATSNRRCRGEHPRKCDISRHHTAMSQSQPSKVRHSATFRDIKWRCRSHNLPKCDISRHCGTSQMQCPNDTPLKVRHSGTFRDILGHATGDVPTNQTCNPVQHRNSRRAVA